MRPDGRRALVEWDGQTERDSTPIHPSRQLSPTHIRDETRNHFPHFSETETVLRVLPILLHQHQTALSESLRPASENGLPVTASRGGQSLLTSSLNSLM